MMTRISVALRMLASRMLPISAIMGILWPVMLRSLALHGREMAARTIELAQYARQEVNKIEGLYSFGEEILGGEATYSYDPTKLTIHVRHLGITGYETENWLRDHYNIEVELSDMYNILCLITPGDNQEDIDILLTALREL